MSLKERIQRDFVVSMKEKNEAQKSALKMLKAKITETEKIKSNSDLNDDEIVRVITSSVKQRKQSIEEFQKFGRIDLVEKESAELAVLESYLPKQMTETELEAEVKEIMSTIDPSNKQKLIGQTIGQFNKKFTGRADNSILRTVVERLANEA
jgi:uncharacterized protein YqeY